MPMVGFLYSDDMWRHTAQRDGAGNDLTGRVSILARYHKVLGRWRALFFYMSLAFLLGGCFGDRRTRPVIFDVSGRVLSAGTGVPISGAKVTVNGKVGMTDSQGLYSLSGITALN